MLWITQAQFDKLDEIAVGHMMIVEPVVLNRELNITAGGRLSAQRGCLQMGDFGRIKVDGQVVPRLNRPNLQTVSRLVLQPGALEMDSVHDYEHGTHCLAGWACYALPDGWALEQKHGWYTAGMALLGWEAAQHFHDSNDDATAWLRQFA